jgi:hypothetical protein
LYVGGDKPPVFSTKIGLVFFNQLK